MIVKLKHVVVIIALLVAPVFVGLKNSSIGAKSAVIVAETEYSSQGVAHNEAISIIDPDTLRKLESFFPNYHKSPASGLPGGWKRGYRVYFNFPHGETLLVDVSTNGGGAFWDMEGGDQKTNGQFKEFVDTLTKKDDANK